MLTVMEVKKWNPMDFNLKYRVRVEQTVEGNNYPERTSYYFSDKHDAMEFAECAFRTSENPTAVFIELVNANEANNG